MLSNERNAKYLTKGFSDMELCEIIDKQMLGRFHAASVYELSSKQKNSLANELKYDLGVKSEKQIARCLALSYER